MNTYEHLQDKAYEDGIKIKEQHFRNERIKGLYCNSQIVIRQDLNSTEKACILAEELGHHYTSVGNILDMRSIQNRKQERQARLHGYNRLIGLAGLIEAYEHSCQDRYEIAEFLEVTDEFLEDCINCYRDKYGIGTTVDNYYIAFIPHLMVGKIK